eukprot:TRINITY_DN156_c0_g2_i3.p1 TRINITY_DN156_c0_g2~~TRINITY_DN156_c0_g2_i3.p1  ORF type:complete len:304 (-),score=80.79 TRINITY_DN156_c0_g2_i3:357-1268(-)
MRNWVFVGFASAALCLGLFGVNAVVFDTVPNDTNSSTLFSHTTGNFGPQAGTYAVIGMAAAPFITDNSFDGCKADAFTGADVSNKIVVIPRGNCNFTDKVINAQRAGAIGVVIANTDAARPDQLLVMSPADSAIAQNISIPSVFVSFNTNKQIGLLMQSASGTGVAVRIILDSQGEVSKFSIGGVTVANGSNDMITSLIRMVLFLAAGFPSLWMCWLSCFFVSNAFQHCLDKCKRRNRIADIPTVKYDTAKNQDKTDPGFIHNSNCVICWDEFIDGQSIRVLPCAHGFCANCIQSWLADRSDL